MCSKSKFQVPILKMYIKRGSETYVQIMCSMSKVLACFFKVLLMYWRLGLRVCCLVVGFESSWENSIVDVAAGMHMLKELW